MKSWEILSNNSISRKLPKTSLHVTLRTNHFFKPFSSDARVVNGEGVVTFNERTDAEEAVRQMDGRLILSSNVQCHLSSDDNSDTHSVSTNNSRRSSTDSDNGKSLKKKLLIFAKN